MATKENNDKFKWSIEEKPIKIDKWDSTALKNTLDDAAKKVILEDKGYVESHKLVDGRLVICTISVCFALFALVWDYLYPFPESRPILIICVLSYFFMMGVLTLYTTFKEKAIFLVALEKDKAGIDPDSVWELSSHLKRYDDKYMLSIEYFNGETRQRCCAAFTKSVANFFDENGLLCVDLFKPEILKIHNSLSSEKKRN